MGSVPAPGGGTYLWEVNSGSGFVAAPGTNNTQNYTTGALTAGIYTFQRESTTTSGVICSTTSNSVTITVNATPAAPTGILSITNSTCTNCTLSGGTIAVGTVSGTGGTLQYSTDAGATWSSTLPVYDQDGPAQTIYASVLQPTDAEAAIRWWDHGSGHLHHTGGPHGHAGHYEQHLHELHAERGGTIALGTVSGTGGTLQYSTDKARYDMDATLPVHDQDGHGPKRFMPAFCSTNGCRSGNTPG